MSNELEGENIPVEDRAKQLPTPSGWKLLCAVPEIDDRFEGTDIVRPDSNKAQEQLATVVLFVVKLGPDAYKDTAKYPSGPWCKEGDFILARQYSGTRLLIHGKEFRVIYDDQVEAVVQDPRGISRV